MIIQFTLKNFRSFKDETTIDMTAVTAYKEHSYNLIDLGLDEKYLKVATIYGANASGKSNVVLAFEAFKSIIRESLNVVPENEKSVIEKYYDPFSFNEESQDTEFEIYMYLDGEEYQYGFTYNKERIVTEWLYRRSLKTNRLTKIIERNMDDPIYFGATVRRQCAKYADQIPKETLALTFFNKLKNAPAVFNITKAGIEDTLILDSGFFEDKRFIELCLPECIDTMKAKLMKFLKAIDTGIVDISFEDRDGEKEYFTEHEDQSGARYRLSLWQESSGTLKSIAIFYFANLVISQGKTLFVDELNTKLHPLLLKLIIDLFNESETTAQLIYTTHDLTLLDKKFVRRDQVWFVQKDAYGHSTLSSLAEFKVRSDASFEKDYLAGVYGGIPELKAFSIQEGA